MKISLSSSSSVKSAVKSAPNVQTQGGSSRSEDIKSFGELLKGLKQQTTPIINLEKFLDKAITSKQISPTELIQAQIAVGKYQLRAELLSKFAEGVNATLRRLQQG